MPLANGHHPGGTVPDDPPGPGRPAELPVATQPGRTGEPEAAAGEPLAGQRTPADAGTDADPVPRADRPWLRAARAAFAGWLAAGLAYVLVTVHTSAVKGSAPTAVGDLVELWRRWDTGHYLQIAAEGYSYPEAPAFFPLYPLLIRATDPVIPQGPLIAALVVAALAGYGALVMMFRLAEHEFDTGVARRAMFYLMIFPTGFYLFCAYNESLFLFLTIGALYFARTGSWWAAGAFAAGASGTRLFGILLLLPLGLEYLRQFGWRPRQLLRPELTGLLLAPLGLVEFVVYCWLRLGDPLAFLHAQDTWGRAYGWPGKSWVVAFNRLNDELPMQWGTLINLAEVMATLLAAVALVLCIVGPWRFRRDQFPLVAHSALALALLLSTELQWGRTLQSSTRYVLELVAVFLLLARMGRHQLVDRVYVLLALTLQTCFLLVLLSGGGLVG